MSDLFHGWKRAVGLLTVVAGFAFFSGQMRIEVRSDSRISDQYQNALQSSSEVEIIQADQETHDEATGVPKISIHVCMIEFAVSSPDALTILSEYAAHFDSALADFNASPVSNSGEFIGSEHLATLIKDFKPKGKITIHDEMSRTISNGETDNWGSAISISATPRFEAEGNSSVFLTSKFGESRIQTTVNVPFRQTLMFGGTEVSSAETKSHRIPLLGNLPTVGDWFAFHFTQMTGHREAFLLSVRCNTTGPAEHSGN